MTGDASHQRIIRYDPQTYDFADQVRNALDVSDLCALRADNVHPEGWSIYKAMEDTDAYRQFWAHVDSDGFRNLYRTFLREIVAPLFDEPIRAQAVPTPRILFADQQGTARYHRDADYGHDHAEVNFFLPLTPCTQTNALWIETRPGAGDHRPIAMEPGEMLMFDGAVLSHGARPNRTGRSRVSFDFRVIAESDAIPSHRREGSINDPRSPHLFMPVPVR